MTAEERTILEITDVIAVRVECVKCGAAAVIKPAEWIGQRPAKCPSCDAQWILPDSSGGYGPLQHLAAGLKLLLTHGKATDAVQLPYRVKLEVKTER